MRACVCVCVCVVWRCACACVHAKIKNVKFNSKAISWFLRKFAPSKISRYTVYSIRERIHCSVVSKMPTVSNGFLIVSFLSDNVVIVEMSQFVWRGFTTVALRSTQTSFTATP